MMLLQSTWSLKAWRAAALAAAVLALAASPAAAQAAGGGDTISPAYEGWEQNRDGSYNLVFGYMNRNWDALDIPVGPDNVIEPGGPDQGQPTHFLPRRNRVVFRIHVPADFGEDDEVVWSITANGETQHAYATLHPDYFLNDIAIMNNNGAGGPAGGAFNIFGNRPPTLDVVGGSRRSATVGEPVALTARASDDGVPKRRAVSAPVLGIDTGLRGTPDSASGLRLVWFVYRGPGEQVTFDPPQYDVWENYRGGANSPWAPGWGPPPVPPGGTWEVNATFAEPGTYVLRAQAHDGGLETNREVTVTVSETTE